MSISFSSFGPIAYPLLMCSFLGLLLIIERFIYFATWKSGGSAQQALALARTVNEQTVITNKNRLINGALILIRHSEQTREFREEIVSHWLAQERNQLFKHLGWLTLLAVISPMLGLLGTVMGIIKVFTAIASHAGPVSPALLADGLGQAMLTTAAGLSIAIPVLITLHGFRIWANNQLTALVETLNEVNLLLDGIDFQEQGAVAILQTNSTNMTKVNAA
jgi:biopolymer transport protein ExbB